MGIAFGRSNPMPRDARLARRDHTASAVSARVCVLHPFATTAPDPHLQNASGRRPSWIEAGIKIEGLCGGPRAQRCSFFEFIPKFAN
jgi:hypothetical protein